jgi:hypothetical protein
LWTGKADTIETCRRDPEAREIEDASRKELKNGEALQEILNIFSRNKHKQ